MIRKRKCLFQAKITGLITTGALALVAAVSSAGSLEAQQPPAPRNDLVPAQNDQLIELNRGPVHEAFAQPYQMKSGGDFIVQQQPPQPIDEVPPQQVPQSSEYKWIPGYWGWEPGDKRFIWISGIFRKAPEEMTWNPGYWTQVNDGYAWVSGCWVRDQQLYLISQTPPDPKPEEPGQRPSPEHFWVPGHYDYVQRDFQWNPGFWARGVEDFVWVPARYLWTPRGYLAVDGYWDYPLDERGILYSPVAFRDQPNPGYRYSPRMIVRTSYLPTHLFVYDRYGHYCYGDYYGFRPARGHFYPWAVANLGYYDPLWMFFTTFQRDRFDYYRNRHQYYHDHDDYRPRHTWRDQRQFISNRNVNVADALLAVGVNELLDGDNDFRSRYRFGENRERWDREADRSRQFRALSERRESAFRGDEKGRPDESSDINLGPIHVKVNPERVPSSLDRGKDVTGDVRGQKGANRTLPGIDAPKNRDSEDADRPIRRETRKLPPPTNRGRDDVEPHPDRPDKPGRPDTPNKPETPKRPELPNRPDVPDKPGKPDTPRRPELPNRPDVPNKSEKPQTPDRPDRPEKPQKPDIKPGQGPAVKDAPGKPQRDFGKQDVPKQERGNGPERNEKGPKKNQD